MNNVAGQWSSLSNDKALTTKEKLDKLIELNLKQSKSPKKNNKNTKIETDKPFIIIESIFSLDDIYGGIKLSEWDNITQNSIATLFSDETLLKLNKKEFLYFDTETTGLSGGTGTIPFMLGFGYFEDNVFKTKVFILNDISKEDEMLEAVDEFIEEGGFSATITYNGKTYDFPLMETRYILNRKRFPLLKLPHLDFLYPARTIWKNTYQSRKLGYLGDILLGISRDDDIDGSQIPSLYFSYLRTGNFSLIEKVISHNELDLVGLSALVLKSLKYIENINNIDDEGEILGLGDLCEKSLDLIGAEQKYLYLIENCERIEIKEKAIKRLSIIKKKAKLYREAATLWELLENSDDKDSHRELAIYYEHRDRNYLKALDYAKKALEFDLSKHKRDDILKRIKRLKTKISSL